MVLARLRLGHCALAAAESRWSLFKSAVCGCGYEEESVEHFLLQCPQYECERQVLFDSVKRVFDGVITEEVLLGGGTAKIALTDRQKISQAVYRYVEMTGREI